MNRTQRLLDAYRHIMKTRGMRYRDLAEKLGVSVPTIKRLFNQGSEVSLERLEHMCAAIGIDFFQLVDAAREELDDLSTSWEQEELLSDARTLSVFAAATMGFGRGELERLVPLPRVELDGILRDLEAVDLIERHPHGRLRPKVSYLFRWIPDGPFERTFVRRMRSAFIAEALDGDGFSAFRHLYMTAASYKELNRRVAELYQEAVATSRTDMRNHGTDELISVGTLLASQTWAPDVAPVRELA